LKRFQRGTDIWGEEKGDPYLWTAQCKHCGAWVNVNVWKDLDNGAMGFAFSEEQTIIYGTALKQDCK
jgi:hypothetical protein